MALNFPDNPTINETTTVSGIKYAWDGSRWITTNTRVLQKNINSLEVVDLSKGSYFKIDSSDENFDTNFSFINFQPGSGNWIVEISDYSVLEGWDISTASYVQNFLVSAQDSAPSGLFFKPDGTKMYVLGDNGRDVNEYDLSTAWDISSASYVQNFLVSAQDTAPTGLSFKPDGTKMYVLGLSGRDVNEYDLSTAWDISSASYVQNFLVSAQDTAPYGLFFKPDGTKMYVLGDSGNVVNEYDLSTAWDISTASYVQNFLVSAQETAPRDIFFKPDGTKMYVLGNAGRDVNEYDLSTAWDISSASYVQNFLVSAQDTAPTGLFFKPDGTKMYVLGDSGNVVNEYSLLKNNIQQITWPENIIWEGITAPQLSETQVLIIDFYTPDSGTTIFGIPRINTA